MKLINNVIIRTKLSKFKNDLLDLFFETDPRPVAVMLTGIILIWAIVLLMPSTTFDRSYYAGFVQLLDPFSRVLGISAEACWGLIFFIVGGLGLSQLKKRKLIPAVTFSTVVLLAVLTAVLIQGNQVTPGPWIHVFLTCSSLWVHTRSVYDSGKKSSVW